jgi:hypothetical protein|tara:strand:- start:443 stop:679 length:237 start_codon:yes stop_codon:yes gene_type:complete
MSTELRSVPNTDIMQTRFYGGKERGTCIQLTPPWETQGHIQLTRSQAMSLAGELMLFANKFEVPQALEDIVNDEGRFV